MIRSGAACWSLAVRALVASLALLTVAPASTLAQFTYRPPGELQAPEGRAPRPGAGRVDSTVYAPRMRFPLEAAPAFLNSQIYGPGGFMGPRGGQCDESNYSYPWFDNYCEERSWDMPLCPSGKGHQGQDIRPATCEARRHWAVAAEGGQVTNIGSYSVYITAADGTRYDYLHLDMANLAVRLGDTVRRGERIGRVSNDFGGTATTIHLHFNIRQNISGVGFVFAPTYQSLVRSYEALLEGRDEPSIWGAGFVEQSFPFASEELILAPGEELPGYFKMRNTGTETWNPGEVFFAASNPRDADSALKGPGWVSSSRAATVSEVVEPGGIGTFSFSLHAPLEPGVYSQFFNLVTDEGLWFSDSGGPPDAQLEVRMQVEGSPVRRDAGQRGADAGIDAIDAGPARVVSDAGQSREEPPRGRASGGCSAADSSRWPETGLGWLVAALLWTRFRRQTRV